MSSILKVDLGGEGRYPSGVKTVNIDPDSGADYICDITYQGKHGLNQYFEKESIDVISCYHTLEHIPVEKLFSTLRFWRTFLTLSGKLHIVVPDGHQLTMDYAVGKICWEVFASILYNRTPYKDRSSYQQHYWSWTELTLSRDLLNAGFEFVAPFGNSIYPGVWLFKSPGFEHYEEYNKYEYPNLRLTAYRTKPK